MIPLYKLLLDASGLSQREAAVLHEVRQDSVSSWSAGRRNAPFGAIQDLARLIAQQIEAADEMAELIDDKIEAEGSGPEITDLGIASDDHEAQGLGWPCASAQHRSMAMVAALAVDAGLTVKIVPRGTTPLSASAADVHDRKS